jgi:hypothetical protein
MVMVGKWTGELVHQRGLKLELFLIMVHKSTPSTKVLLPNQLAFAVPPRQNVAEKRRIGR